VVADGTTAEFELKKLYLNTINSFVWREECRARFWLPCSFICCQPRGNQQ